MERQSADLAEVFQFMSVDKEHNTLSYTIGSDAFLNAFNKDAELQSLFSIDADLSAMLDFERCLTIAQSTAGLIPKDHKKSILAALQQFDPDLDLIQKSFAQDGVSTAISDQADT